MAEFGVFLLYWLAMMALVGLSLFIVQRFRKKDNNETVDPATYEIVSPYDPDKKEKLDALEKRNKKIE